MLITETSHIKISKFLLLVMNKILLKRSSNTATYPIDYKMIALWSHSKVKWSMDDSGKKYINIEEDLHVVHSQLCFCFVLFCLRLG